MYKSKLHIIALLFIASLQLFGAIPCSQAQSAIPILINWPPTEHSSNPAATDTAAYETGQEKKILALKKRYTEKQAQLERSNDIIVGLTGLVLFLIATVLYLCYAPTHQRTDELKALNQHLKMEREKLSLTNSKLRRFSSIVSHDILANLDLILTSGNVMAGRQSSAVDLPRYYEMTQHTARSLKDYCLKLLREAEHGHVASPPQTYPMPILEKVLARYETRLLQAGYEVETTPLSAAPLSETQIEQLFQNLVSNALRHAAEVEHPKLFIAEKQDKNGRYWIIEDNGPGLTDEMKRTVFEPTTSLRSNGVGQRVGLSLLHACLAESGVSITVEDAAIGGARFVIRF
jgi:signal transduction histidine kinase